MWPLNEFYRWHTPCSACAMKFQIPFRVFAKLVWPKIDLAIRLWLAQLFLVSGVIKATHWETALQLAANEYPVSWMSPVTAAYLGVSIELLGAVLLAVGFMTRYAAIPMLILSLVIQFAYLPFDNQLFWAVLLGWYAIQGAGAFSLDALLRRGLADSALPCVPAIVRGSGWVREHLSPIYLSVLRIWLGITLLIAARPGVPVIHASSDTLSQFLPLSTASAVPAGIAIIIGPLLIVGVAARYLGIALVLSLMLGAMMDPRLTDAAYLLMVASLFVTFGGGALSVDGLFAAWFIRRSGTRAQRLELMKRPRVVIVGAGFGGLSCAVALRDSDATVTLIDRSNHHLFQPLLYQVATAALSPGDIAAPIRPLFRDAPLTQVLLGTVTGVDRVRQEVQIGARNLPFDYLVIATGAAHSYFGKDQWAPFAPGLKRIEDATEIRRRILTAFESAEAATDESEREALLTFLVVGGGPTGVELAGSIAELARFGMDKEFRNFDPAHARVILVQSAPRLLPSFPETLAAIAQQSLERLGVEVVTKSRVEDIDARGVAVSGRRIASRTVLWAAGVMASPAAKWLGAAADSAGRVKVSADLSVPGADNIYAIGDTALSDAWNGEAVPGLAPAAKQGGIYVARHILARIAGRPSTEPFRYRHLGSLATIGRKSAVADFGFIKLWGAPAWWLWGLVHVGFLVGLRNRAATMLNWFWSYLTFGGGIRLITGSDREAAPVVDQRPSSNAA